jgi:dTDP-4-amino-4,6-dideoxygalactose transaminase
MNIPFNKPFIVGKELYYIAQAVQKGNLAGDGPFTKKCSEWFEKRLDNSKVLLVHSCTAALEMAAILCDIQPGDEVIMPSYTFVSTANAFALRGAKIVFVEVHKKTLNIDERKIESAITDKTKAIVPVHYAGVACEMDKIIKIANKYKLIVIEDAAQGVCATYKGKSLGTIGDIGCYSFHETKNFISGEGGAIILNNPQMIERAEIIREKGTNRSKFFRGQVDKYTWVDIGSSYLASELTAAFLLAQLEEVDKINIKRNYIWNKYYDSLSALEKNGLIKRPTIPNQCIHNAHMFYIILENLEIRTKLLEYLKKNEIYAVFHYIPLHLSPMGKKMGGYKGQLPITENYANRLLRLPCFYDLTETEIEYVISKIFDFFKKIKTNDIPINYKIMNT